MWGTSCAVWAISRGHMQCGCVPCGPSHVSTCYVGLCCMLCVWQATTKTEDGALDVQTRCCTHAWRLRPSGEQRASAPKKQGDVKEAAAEGQGAGSKTGKKRKAVASDEPGGEGAGEEAAVDVDVSAKKTKKKKQKSKSA